MRLPLPPRPPPRKWNWQDRSAFSREMTSCTFAAYSWASHTVGGVPTHCKLFSASHCLLFQSAFLSEGWYQLPPYSARKDRTPEEQGWSDQLLTCQTPLLQELGPPVAWPPCLSPCLSPILLSLGKCLTLEMVPEATAERFINNVNSSRSLGWRDLNGWFN